MSSDGNYSKGITKFLRKHLTFGRVGFMVYVVLCSGAPKPQPAEVLVLKTSQKRSTQFKVRKIARIRNRYN